MKQALFAFLKQNKINSWNQPVLSTDGKVSCLMKQREMLMGLKLTEPHQLLKVSIRNTMYLM